MYSILTRRQNQPIISIGNKFMFIGDVDVDVDGSGSSHGDPYFQPDTSLHYNGKALNADLEDFIVVPLDLPRRIGPVVLGCQAFFTNLVTAVRLPCVVGDLGPLNKIGEASRSLCIKAGVHPSPITGGDSELLYLYEFFPGVPAEVNGRKYQLQPFRSL